MSSVARPEGFVNTPVSLEEALITYQKFSQKWINTANMTKCIVTYNKNLYDCKDSDDAKIYLDWIAQLEQIWGNRHPELKNKLRTRVSRLNGYFKCTDSAISFELIERAYRMILFSDKVSNIPKELKDTANKICVAVSTLESLFNSLVIAREALAQSTPDRDSLGLKDEALLNEQVLVDESKKTLDTGLDLISQRVNELSSAMHAHMMEVTKYNLKDIKGIKKQTSLELYAKNTLNKDMK